MEIKYIFKLILKWLWLIVLVPILAGAGAYYVCTYRMIPVYEATATMYIVRSLDDPEGGIIAVNGEIESAQNAIRNYSEIIKSKSVINEALNALNLKGYTVVDFEGNISLVYPDMYSFVIGISVKDVDPKLASDMANKLSEIFVDKTDRLMQMSVIKILDRAEVPDNPINDKTMRNVVVAIMAGFIFSAVIVFFVEYSESVIIKGEKDVLKYLELPALAAIPKTKYIKTIN